MYNVLNVVHFSKGALNSGSGLSQMNSFLAAINIPEVNIRSFKTHEKEVCAVAEKIANETCKRAGVEERKLTLENLENILQLL